jgi:hypothetical protein
MSQINPSDEQQKIIHSITNGKNVVVNSVAGAGKTTTLLFIAQQNPTKKILQVTYNKQLKLEVRNKITKFNITNVEIHTYHSLAVKNYDRNCFTDDGIINIIKKNIKPINELSYDIIVIDEVQDMTPNYYELIYKFMCDISFKSNILILGDVYQGVYEFKNADTRYLSLSHKIWQCDDFEQLTLNQSYRVTKQIAWFVNSAMLGANRIISHKECKHPIYYYKRNIHTVANILYTKIKHFLANGYYPQDIFILSPSIKSSTNPVKKLENILVKNKIPVYFSRNEEEGIDEQIIAGKTVFTSFHQSKGRERKIVIVYGFDDTYFDFYAKEKNRYVCPSELYVAVTRASEILILIEHDKNDPLSFLKLSKEHLESSPYIEYINEPPKKKENEYVPKEKKILNTHTTSVTELTSYLSESTMKEIIPMINMIYKVTSPPNPKLTVDIPLNVKMKSGLVEDVSDLNGLVIPAIYEAKRTNNLSSIQRVVETFCENTTAENYTYIENKKKDLLANQNNAISIYLLLGNLYIALTENILSKLNQIDRYDWLTSNIIKICHKNMKMNIGQNAKYEQVITDKTGQKFNYSHHKYGLIEIGNRIDIYDDETLWEIKCTSSITIEHMMQLLIYAWLWEQCMKEKYGARKYKLLNIRTGEVRELIYTDYIIVEITELIFINKYEPKNRDSDLIFLEKCKKIKRKYS